MSNHAIPGGSFVLQPPAAIFTPEQFSEQHRLIAQTAAAFARDAILPAAEAIEQQDFPLVRRLLRQAGALGLSAVDVPEEYGGLGLDLIASAIVVDRLAVLGSFSVSFGAHAGIGLLPLVHFGSPEQKRRYLPGLAQAELVGAYALSEAGSGSDAMALHTRAQLSPEGHAYRLDGEKMWISNAGFADLFTVFAKVGDEVTAFLVEPGFPGVTTGPEEHKMGILGSSTRPLLLRGAEVPVANRLGAVGQGRAIAFQILNLGRFKLAAACLGGARSLLAAAAAYARQRHTFGQPIASHGLIQHSLAGMALGLFSAESSLYRTAGLLAASADLDEYAIECSLVKVDASEMLDAVADAAVQIFGGNGYMRGNPAERAYRDSRVNRIFEGTNEINRLLLSGLLLRRAQKNLLPLLPVLQQLRDGILTLPTPDHAAEQARLATLLVIGLALDHYREAIADQQEVLAAISDLMIGLFRIQSVLARRPDSPLAQLAVGEALDAMDLTARRVLAAVSEGDALRTRLAWLRRLLRRDPVNHVALRRLIAAQVLEAQGYPG